MRLRLGVGAAQFGHWGRNMAEQARLAEAAGFDSIWLGDHVISPMTSTSVYPYTESGEIPWRPETEMFDAVVSATVAVTATTRITVGFGTLVLPLRQPVVLAKQLATLDRFSGGRIVLGAGFGWSREEFAALEACFDERESVVAEWIDLLRACWTGHPGMFLGRHYQLTVPTACYPTPVGRLPILIGGASGSATDLVARSADGWYPLLNATRLTKNWLAPRWRQVRERAAGLGRDPDQLRLSIYAAADLELVCSQLPELADCGVSEVVVGVDWDDSGSAAAAMRRLASARDAIELPGRMTGSCA